MKLLLIFLFATIPLLAAPRLVVSDRQIGPTTTIEVVFDKAMVGPNQLGKVEANHLLTIKPAWKNKITWRTQNIARLVPQEAPEIATSYQFSLTPNLKALDGGKISIPNFADVSSEQFVARRVQRVGNVRTGGLFISFNHAVDPAAAAAFFQFTRPEIAKTDKTEFQASATVAARTRQATWGDLPSRYYYQPSWEERFNRTSLRNQRPYPEPEQVIPHALVVEPVSPLPIGKKWSLRRLAELPNKAGTAKVGKGNNHSIGDVIPFLATWSGPVVTPEIGNSVRMIRLSFNQSLPKSLKPEEFLNFLEIDESIDNLKVFFDHRHQNLSITGDFSKKDQYRISLKPTLVSETRLPLAENFSKIVKFSRLEPRIELPSFDESQLASGSRTYQIQSINNQAIQLRIKYLTVEELARASLGYRHYTGNGPDSKRFKQRIALPFELIPGKVVANETVKINAPLDSIYRHTLKWDDYLAEGQKTGAFFVSVTGESAEHRDLKRAPVKSTQALVQLTDLGLAWKITGETVFLYAYSCETGQPLSNVNFTFIGEDAAELGQARSNENGIGEMERPDDTRLLRASVGDDTFTLPFDRSLPSVYMWQFPINYEWGERPERQRLVELFTDRNLYRPGEKVRLKGIVRDLHKDQFSQPSKKDCVVTVLNPRGREVSRQEITLSENGSFDLVYDFPPKVVGRYTLNLIWSEELEAAEELESYWERRNAMSSAKFSHYVSVQEFKRNTFEVEASLDEKLHYEIESNYFQGTPVADAKAAWYLTAKHVGFYPEKHRDFFFCDHRSYDSYYWSHYFGYRDDTVSSRRSHSEDGETQLTSEGKLVLDFMIPALEFPTPRAVEVLTEITDANSQTLSSKSTTTIHSSEFYLGLSRQDSITRVGEEIPFQIVAVDQAGERLEVPAKVRISVEREVNSQTKSKAPNGRVVVKNTSNLVPVLKKDISLVPGVFEFPFTPQESGRHIITLTSEDSQGQLVKTVVNRQVYGEKAYPWAYEDGIKIKLVPERKRYQPGEKARILVLSPIEGEALITVEREGVLRNYRRPLTMSDPVVEIPLDDADAPNVFVSVLVIKGSADSKRKNPQPQLRLGYCQLNVDPAAARLNVDLATGSSETRPGETVEVLGKVTDRNGDPVTNAEVTFYAEDEGTLAVIGYENPDPLSYFYAPRPMRNENGTSLGSFLTELVEDREFGNKGFIVGGGDGEPMAMGSTSAEEIRARSNFDPCAAWEPVLKTANDGTFSVKFAAPDTLTRYRLIAVAHEGSERFGTGASEAVVNKPFMLEPSPPAFAHEGDKLTPKALLQNTTEIDGRWKVSLKLDSTTAENRVLVREVDVPAGGQSTVSFDVTFQNTGTANWVWTAEPVSLSQGDLTQDLRRELSDSVESTFEVRYPMPLLHEVQFVSLNDSSLQKNLLEGFSQNLLEGRGELELEFARSRLLEAAGAIDYLLRYPYGCLEQTTSSTIPWVAAKNLRHLAPGFQRKSPEVIDATIQKGADRILSMQTRDGGFAYWTGGTNAEAWATSYGGLGLVMCRDAGADVPQMALDELATYLSGTLRDLRSLKTSYGEENHARALYVLAKLGKAEPAYHAKLLERSEKLSKNARAFLALAMHEAGQEGAVELLRLPAAKIDSHGYWMRYRADQAIPLLAWSEIAPKEVECEEILNELLGHRSPQGHWRTTWSNAWSLLAMGSYASANEVNTGPINLVVKTDEGSQKIVLAEGEASKKIILPLRNDLTLAVESDSKVYVHSLLSSKPEIAPIQPVSQNGISVTRKYERVLSSGKTEELGEPKVGDLVKVTVTIGLPDKDLRYLAIDDPLPASFQAVNTDFTSQAGRVNTERTWRVSNREIRTDRALFFVNYPGRSKNIEVSYHARVTHPGSIYVPPTKVEEMYDPENYALGASRNMIVQ